MKKLSFLLLFTFVFIACNSSEKKDQIAEKPKQPFVWEGANVYFLLTDRFNNADKTNDINFGRDKETAVLRGFEGGDLKGVTQKINEGY